jgi:hypothetical protein
MPRPQFSLRSLFVLTAVVAVCVASRGFDRFVDRFFDHRILEMIVAAVAIFIFIRGWPWSHLFDPDDDQAEDESVLQDRASPPDDPPTD